MLPRRRFHRDKRHQLQEMVLEHVTEAPRFFVVAAAVLDAQRFGRGYLNMVDVLTVPDRLDDRIGKPEREDVLDGVLSEIVINPKDLLFIQGALDGVAEITGAAEVAAEWLFDHDARPH
jgi:hypothetical protein